jgi:RimJ/RimL family protein N-acetyltransferase
MRFYLTPFDRAFEISSGDRLISLIRPENVPSWSVAKKLGLQPWRSPVRGRMAHLVWSMERP